MNKTYQQLKNKIIKEMPEINTDHSLRRTDDGDDWKFDIIIGRDITLSDCLRVLDKKRKDDWEIKLESLYQYKRNNCVWKIQINHDNGGHGIEWDLTKNALHQQKPEVWELLNNLID